MNDKIIFLVIGAENTDHWTDTIVDAFMDEHEAGHKSLELNNRDGLSRLYWIQPFLLNDAMNMLFEFYEEKRQGD